MSALTEAEEQRWLVDRERGGWQYATERIVAEREAAAREAVLAEVEALAERMLACVGCYDEAIQDCPRYALCLSHAMDVAKRLDAQDRGKETSDA